MTWAVCLFLVFALLCFIYFLGGQDSGSRAVRLQNNTISWKEPTEEEYEKAGRPVYNSLKKINANNIPYLTTTKIKLQGVEKVILTIPEVEIDVVRKEIVLHIDSNGKIAQRKRNLGILYLTTNRIAFSINETIIEKEISKTKKLNIRYNEIEYPLNGKTIRLYIPKDVDIGRFYFYWGLLHGKTFEQMSYDIADLMRIKDEDELCSEMEQKYGPKF